MIIDLMRTDGTSMFERPEPFDPRCQRFARDMTELDDYLREPNDPPDRVITPEERADWVRENEGTYNSHNGHFACDDCYIAMGMPSSRLGWKCP